MVNVSKVCIAFSNQTETYEIGENKVKSIAIDEKEGLIKICYEQSSNRKYLIVPTVLLDSYDYV